MGLLWSNVHCRNNDAAEIGIWRLPKGLAVLQVGLKVEKYNVYNIAHRAILTAVDAFMGLIFVFEEEPGFTKLYEETERACLGNQQPIPTLGFVKNW